MRQFNTLSPDVSLPHVSYWAAAALHRAPAAVLDPATGAAAAPAHFPKAAQKVAQTMVLVAPSLVRFLPDWGCIRHRRR